MGVGLDKLGEIARGSALDSCQRILDELRDIEKPDPPLGEGGDRDLVGCGCYVHVLMVPHNSIIASVNRSILSPRPGSASRDLPSARAISACQTGEDERGRSVRVLTTLPTVVTSSHAELDPAWLRGRSAV